MSRDDGEWSDRELKDWFSRYGPPPLNPSGHFDGARWETERGRKRRPRPRLGQVRFAVMAAGVAALVVAGQAIVRRPFPPRIQSPAVAEVSGPAIHPGTAYGPVVFLTNQVGWVAESQRPDILHTTDGGRTWTTDTLPRGLIATAIRFTTPEDGVALGQTACGASSPHCLAALLITHDGGSHWSITDSQSFSSSDETQANALAVNGGSVYAVLMGQPLLSSDGGSTWSRVPVPAGVSVQTIFAGGPGTMFVGVGYCSGGADCGRFGLLRSTDRGARWTTTWTGSGRPQSVTMVSPRTGYFLDGPNLAMVSMGGAAGTLYRTTDGGLTWTGVQSSWKGTGQSGFQMAALWDGPDVGWIPVSGGAGSGVGGLEVTRDGGRHWARMGSPAWSLSGASLVSQQDGWITGVSRPYEEPFLLHTSDGGTTWTQVLPALSPSSQVDMINVHLGFGLGTASDPNAVLMTENGGDTWHAREGPPLQSGQTVSAIQFLSAQKGFALVEPQYPTSLASSGQIYLTVNAGRTWSRSGSVPLGSGTAFQMTTSGTGIVQGTRLFTPRVAFTETGGRTFQLSPFNPAPGSQWNVSVGSGTTAWVTEIKPGSLAAKIGRYTGETLVLDRVDLKTGQTERVYAWPNPGHALVYNSAPVEMLPDGSGFVLSSTVQRTGKTIQKPAGNGKSIAVPQTRLEFDLWVSHDYGKTWAAVKFPSSVAGNPATLATLDFVSPRVGFLLAAGGLYETTDGGYHWTWKGP